MAKKLTGEFAKLMTKSIKAKGAKKYKPAPKIGKVIPLREAEKSGIKVQVKTPPTYSAFKFILTNETKEPAHVELTGNYLLPEDSSFQRLLVAGLEEAPETGVNIQPGETKEVVVNGCCMDQPKNPPDGKVEYRVAPQRAPSRMVKAAEDWLEARRALPPNPTQAPEGLDMRVCLDDEQVDKQHGNSDALKKLLSRGSSKLEKKASVGELQSVVWGESN